MAKNIVRGYYDESYPPLPTKATRFWRRNFNLASLPLCSA